MPEDDVDTLPPDPDPLMAIAVRLERKIDHLQDDATACFAGLREHRAEIDALRKDVDSLKRWRESLEGRRGS